MRALGFIGKLFSQFPALLIACTVLWVLVGLFEAVAIFTVAPVVDLLVHGSLTGASPVSQEMAGLLSRVGVPVTLTTVLGVFVFFNLIKSLFQLAARHMILRAKYAVLRDLMVGTFSDFLRARWYFFASDNQGRMLNTFTREMTVVGSAFGSMALFFAAILQLLMYLVVPLYLSWQITLISCAAAVALGTPFLLLGGVSYRLGQRNTSTANDMSSLISESLGSVKVVLGYGQPEKNVDRLGRAFDAHSQASVRSQTLDVGIPILYLPIGLSVMAIALAAGSRLGAPLAESAAVLYSLMRMVPVIGQILQQKTSLDNFFPSYEQVIAQRKRAEELKQVTGTREFKSIEKEIRLEAAGFTYPGHEPVLLDINITIPRGKMIAVVGESGAGKSTLIDLIMGFHAPTAGRLTLDGVDLNEYDVYSYRRRIGYVPQESILFHMSIRDNLLWSRETATQEEIEAACGQAHAADFIRELPEGYDTVVGDRGVRLSGGQVQRIALARAILRDPDLLVLDEATSSLDSKSESMIQKAIEDIARQRTLVVIAHRLSTIAQADYIYVLGKGAVVEEGTRAELLEKKGVFARMLEFQEREGTEAAG